MQPMEHELDVRGARCPVPYVRARALVGSLAPGDVLRVLTTDPEARVDLAALAADEHLAVAVVQARGVWTISLRR